MDLALQFTIKIKLFLCRHPGGKLVTDSYLLVARVIKFYQEIKCNPSIGRSKKPTVFFFSFPRKFRCTSYRVFHSLNSFGVRDDSFKTVRDLRRDRDTVPSQALLDPTALFANT